MTNGNGDDSLKLVNLRVTYKNAPIHILEKFAFKDVNEANDLFLGNHKVKECVIVQTCNRVELFVAIQNQLPQEILQKWASVTGLSDSLVKFIEISEDNTAFRHLLSLTSGLDSLVVGEDQVLGQVKRAFEFARHNKHAGSYLSLVFSHAIKTGTRIRNQTGLNKGSVSIGSIAVNLAEDYFDDLQDKNVLVIGTGESASLIAKSLTKRHVSFMVASRTYERAKSFAQTAGGKPIEFEAALTSFDNVDLIFVSTTAPYYLVTFDRVQTGMTQRKHGMMIFDLSNPRTVEDNVASIPGVKLVNMDQIAEIVDRNMRHRQHEIRYAETMIDKEMERIDALFRKMKAEPFVVSIFKRVDEVRERELRKAVKVLRAEPGSKEYKVLEQLSFAIVEGILSTPMNNFRKEIGNYEKNEELLSIISRIFNYEER